MTAAAAGVARSVSVTDSFEFGGAAGLRAAGGQDDLVEDAIDEVRAGGLAEHEDAVQDDARQGRADQVDVGVVAELAAVAGPLEDGRRWATLGPRTGVR